MRSTIMAVFCSLFAMSSAIVLNAQQAMADDTLSDEALAARNEAFSKSMENCVLVGSFTVDGERDDKPLKEERYEIESVTHVNENLWNFNVRIKYGKLDTKLPVQVPMEWAGDTPMVTLTNASLPGLGEGFSARVLFYENRYAGTWQHGPVGGHMFGRIERRRKP
ncbi:MAG: hypothetical protein ACK58L_14935 [Planctomycetota bacterium]